MMKRQEIPSDHPLRRLFRRALDFAFESAHRERTSVLSYLEEQMLCEFIRTDNLYKIRDAAGRRLEDIADMLIAGDVRLNALSFEREFQVHKHIGDYTLFMLGMFPGALKRRRGKEFILGSLVIPSADLAEHYRIQGERSYLIASEFTHAELFRELSKNYPFYRDILTLARTYLEAARSREFLKAKGIIGERIRRAIIIPL